MTYEVGFCFLRFVCFCVDRLSCSDLRLRKHLPQINETDVPRGSVLSSLDLFWPNCTQKLAFCIQSSVYLPWPTPALSGNLLYLYMGIRLPCPQERVRNQYLIWIFAKWPSALHAYWWNMCVNRTALEKCTHPNDDTQGTIKHKCFRQRVFVRYRKRDRKY